MKTQLLRLMGLLFLSSFISCEKSSDLDMESLQLELESCKPKKKDLKVGMEYQGGIIFYLDETGKHGLITAKEDVGPAPWGCYGSLIPYPEATPWDSKIAAKTLLQHCKEPGIAARLCAKYEVCENGENGRVYKDWYMAGFKELQMIIKALGPNANMCPRGYLDPSAQVSNFQAGTLDPAKYTMIFTTTCRTTEEGRFIYAFFNMAIRKNQTGYARPIRDF